MKATKHPIRKSSRRPRLRASAVWLIAACLGLLSCSIVETTYDVTVGTLKLGYEVTKFAGKTVYHVGKFTYIVVMAPLSWALTRWRSTSRWM